MLCVSGHCGTTGHVRDCYIHTAVPLIMTSIFKKVEDNINYHRLLEEKEEVAATIALLCLLGKKTPRLRTMMENKKILFAASDQLNEPKGLVQNQSLITRPARLSLVPPPCPCTAPRIDAWVVSSRFLVLSSKKREDGLKVKAATSEPGSALMMMAHGNRTRQPGHCNLESCLVYAFQFAYGPMIILLMGTFKLHQRPKITRAQLAAILPLAVAHTMWNLLTNISLGKVVVSFTHTIKAMEPFVYLGWSLCHQMG
ncbi:hypothetical protein SAY87_007847 [Trapa incisa]|uniref:Sugar phosphate transporter domain-containing protein n=1 Tax=Trapa incisa TaxID=236973 RepID=A0AAN7QIP8_9MYRT|nr:hypothetical protein SAY87_007847 [Trapa incisa]